MIGLVTPLGANALSCFSVRLGSAFLEFSLMSADTHQPRRRQSCGQWQQTGCQDSLN